MYLAPLVVSRCSASDPRYPIKIVLLKYIFSSFLPRICGAPESKGRRSQGDFCGGTNKNLACFA